MEKIETGVVVIARVSCIVNPLKYSDAIICISEKKEKNE